MKLAGNTILITGGTSGIGLAFAKKFLSEGNRVIICGRREERLADIKRAHPEIIVKTADVSVAEERVELVDWAISTFPDLNILINNAGIQLSADLDRPVDLERVYAEVETNFIAPLHLASLITPHLKKQAEAAIINISSGLAFAPLAFMPVYCATKAAIHSLSLSLRYQLKDSSVRVFEIAPPAVDTELGHDRRSDKSESHGGIPVAEFMKEAISALENDVFEAPVGMAKGLHARREELFEGMNNNFVKTR